MKLSKDQKNYIDTNVIKPEGLLINITAGDIEPEIEAFMLEVLEKIQIRANQENAEFLLVV